MVAQTDADDGDTATSEPRTEPGKERDEIREIAGEQGLYTLVFYGSEPWIALVDREKAPPTSHARPNEQIAVIEWASEKPGYPDAGWGVCVVSAEDRSTNPQWELPEQLDVTFDNRADAVEFASETLDK